MARMKVVFISGLSHGLTQEIVDCASPEFDVDVCPAEAPDSALIPAAADADILLLKPSRLSDDVIRSARNAKLIQLLGTGYERVNVGLARECGIPVANNGGANSVAVAEHAIMHMLAVYRRLIPADRNTRAGRWQKGVITRENTFELAGKLVGIVGMGKIGTQVAKRLEAFECRLQYYDPYPLTATEERVLHVKQCPSIEDLLKTSDVVSLHVALTSETSGMIDRGRLSLMKPSAILVNTSRGSVVDQKALFEALQNHRIAGAGLDVLAKEPVNPDDPILTLDNVCLTPHMGGYARETYLRRARSAFENMQAVLAKRPIRWQVN